VKLALEAQCRMLDQSRTLTDTAIEQMAYDEIGTMLYYAKEKMEIYYEENGRARCLEPPMDLPRGWLEDLLERLAARLYARERVRP